MRRAMVRAKWWQWAIVYGVLFAGFELVSGLMQGRRPVGAVIGAIVGGTVFGPLMGRIMDRSTRRQQAALGDIAEPDRRRVTRAALWGPIPQDPADRQASAAYAGRILQMSSRREQVVARIGGVAFVVAACAAAVIEGEWWIALLGLFFAAVVAWSFVLRRRLQRRITLLNR